MNTVKTMALLAAMTALFMSVGYLLGGFTGLIIAFVVALGTNAWAFWNSDKAVLRMHNAQAVTRASHPAFFHMIGTLATEAGLPMPKVYLINDPQPNAFATGRNPENAAVAATTGLLEMLDEDEVAGVMAHELAHIQNRDTLTMTIAATVAGAISMLAQFGFMLGGGRNRGAFGFLGVLLAVVVAPMAAMLIQMMISRTREYAADRRGAEISGNPRGLASALRKISNGVNRFELMTAEDNPSTGHMFILNPLSGARMDKLFSTHPKTENRIAALEAMAESGAFQRTGDTRQSRIPTVRRQ